MRYLGTDLIAIIGMEDPDTMAVCDRYCESEHTSEWDRISSLYPQLRELAYLMAREAVAADDIRYRRIKYPYETTRACTDSAVKVTILA